MFNKIKNKVIANKSSVLFYSGVVGIVGVASYFIKTSKKSKRTKIIGGSILAASTAATVVGHRSAVKTAVVTGIGLATGVIAKEKSEEDISFTETISFDNHSKSFVNNKEEDRRFLESKLDLLWFIDDRTNDGVTLYEVYKALGMLSACKWEKRILTKAALVDKYDMKYDDTLNTYVITLNCSFIKV